MPALVVGPSARAAADVLQEAQELRRQLQYGAAQERLGIALPDLKDEMRARALLLLSQLTTEHKEARRLLMEASRSATTTATRQRIDLELARLDYARGNYRSVLTRLRDDADLPEAALILAQSQIALGETSTLRDALQPARRTDLGELLLGWAQRDGGDPQHALSTFESVAKQRRSDLAPTALLWKAECEAALGLRDRALQSCAELRERFPEAPESQLAAPTLAALQRGSTSGTAIAPPEPAARVVLQVGAFEDRANALRYQNLLAEQIQHVQVEEIHDGNRRLFRVQVGPFETREQAETFGREQLAPRGYSWRVARPGENAP